jgi:hypothetical protein
LEALSTGKRGPTIATVCRLAGSMAKTFGGVMTWRSWWGPATLGAISGALLLATALPAGASSTLAPGAERIVAESSTLAGVDGPSHHFGFNSLLAQASTPPGQQAGKTCVEHRTGSSRNPTVLIEVSQNAVPAHQQHGDRVVGPAPCPSR